MLHNAERTYQGLFNQLTNWVRTPLQDHIERLVKVAHNVFQVPVVAIHLVDDRRFHIEANMGLAELEQTTGLSLHDMKGVPKMIVINDTVKQADQYSDIITNLDPKIRFYLNAPIVEKTGRKVGQLALASFSRRGFDNLDQSNLDDIIRIIESEINSYQLSVAQRLMLESIEKEDKSQYIDQATELWNYHAFKKILHFQVDESKRSNKIFCCAVVDIDNLSVLNEKYGEAFGDQIMRTAAKALRQSSRDNDTIAKSDLHDFICLIDISVEENIRSVLKRIFDRLTTMKFLDDEGNPIVVHVTIGASIFNPEEDNTQRLINAANAALVIGKKKGKNQIAYL
ncbi:diguanylate cyclase [Legionella sp. W05-934-2]|jgi:diguanylate cyclase (GGDEF)-like protein|uniref:diguanylate cyclase domain-containing protein n=1 Tax=Legionella sp. W05-934-2 TaxID=1198649 RepID=UPI0034620AA5